MREIKFRGKCLVHGEWVYGYYLEQAFCDGQGLGSYIKIHGYSPIKVDPDTVGQYTGLKDKKGQEIYEGDIVCLGDAKRRIGVIVRSDTKPAFVLEVNDTTFDLYYRNQHRYEVVGNIYDNQELIKPE